MIIARLKDTNLIHIIHSLFFILSMINWNLKLKMQCHLNWHPLQKKYLGINQYVQDLYEKNYKIC